VVGVQPQTFGAGVGPPPQVVGGVQVPQGIGMPPHPFGTSPQSRPAHAAAMVSGVHAVAVHIVPPGPPSGNVTPLQLGVPPMQAPQLRTSPHPSGSIPHW
jgi:hypothetical protein